MSLGNRIKELRKSKGYTQDELAKLLGLTQSSIRKYETESVINVKFEIIEKLAKIFEVTPSKLVGWDDFDREIDVSNAKDETDILGTIKNRYGYVFVELTNIFDELTDEGKRKVLFYAEDLVNNPKYKIKNTKQIN